MPAGMTLEPTIWNAVAIGGWNPHILSPRGVARHVFGVEEGTPVQLELAIDVPAVYRVSHDGFTVTPSTERLEVTTAIATFVGLSKAAGFLRKAMESLPVTPVSAAGLNIRYVLIDPDGALLPKLKVSLDDSLSDAGLTIKTRRISRTLEHLTGVINLKITAEEADRYEVELNLDCRTSRSEILVWLASSPATLRETARRIMQNVLGATLPEEINAE
jgi:hypothetical protein